MNAFIYERSVDSLKIDIDGLISEAREHMNAAAAAFVFMHGGCGGDCSSRHPESTDELAGTFSAAMAKAALALTTIPGEIDQLVRACAGLMHETATDQAAEE